MLSGCYIPCPHIHKYNIRYKRDKASEICFDPPDFYGALNLFVIGGYGKYFSNIGNIFDNRYLILYLISVP